MFSFSFLKPSLLKIGIAIVFFLLSGWLWGVYVTSRIADISPIGFPLEYYVSWGPCPLNPIEPCSEFNGWFLLVDVFFWYAFGAWLVNYFKKT